MYAVVSCFFTYALLLCDKDELNFHPSKEQLVEAVERHFISQVYGKLFVVNCITPEQVSANKSDDVHTGSPVLT